MFLSHVPVALDDIRLNLRPPAVPLVAHDPYFSIWAPNEKLAEADTQHWTTKSNPIYVNVSVDGTAYRLVGKDSATKTALPQTELRVFPTRTIARYQGAGIKLTLTFYTPTIPSDLQLFATPLTYVEWNTEATDGKPHAIEVEVAVRAEIAGSDPKQDFFTRAGLAGKVPFAAATAKKQSVLQTSGDFTTIDWGTLYVGATKPSASVRGGRKLSVRQADPSGVAVLAYDDEVSIQYFEQNLRPYWRRGGKTGLDLLRDAPRNFASIKKQCEAFDAELVADLLKVGGEKYALLASLAYRQCTAASKLVADAKGQPIWMPKENSSNGCIATVDVIYPMSPQAMLFGPTLLRAMLQPVMAYSASPRWKFPFAPHDLGTYPLANGQVYGGGERTEDNQMPVEESANMLILLAALAHVEGNAKYSEPFWPQITQWAKYLRDKGLDPENQLCTDDFLGHLAHNTNLSAKAIVGLRSYADLAERLGHQDVAQEYKKVSQDFAREWVRTASSGDHTALTFDRKDTWSQKYNLVWDRILNYNLFPAEVYTREMAWYRKNLNAFGLPLDSRGNGAKLDWSVWTATLTENRADFDALIDGLFRFANETPQRVGMSDWYNTQSGNMNFFQARSVVGGVLIPLLYDEAMWQKWAKRDRVKAGTYAPIPARPEYISVVPTAETAENVWRYTTTAPASGWHEVSFDDSGWKSGKAGFGTAGTPGAVVGTTWNTPSIWARRTVELPAKLRSDLRLRLHHDEDVEVYVNGVLAVSRSGYTTDYVVVPLAAGLLKPGVNHIAVHCRQTGGGQYIDVGIVSRKK
jgi:hypothetical protein